MDQVKEALIWSQNCLHGWLATGSSNQIERLDYLMRLWVLGRFVSAIKAKDNLVKRLGQTFKNQKVK